jgi:hypothetical protein
MAAMAIVGVLLGIGALLLGIPSPSALALIFGLSEFVPVVGPIVGAVPVLIVALGEGNGLVRKGCSEPGEGMPGFVSAMDGALACLRSCAQETARSAEDAQGPYNFRHIFRGVAYAIACAIHTL